ncbi:MAG: aminoglycoside phosphotransferase family protein [Anaerolineales bacterium]
MRDISLDQPIAHGRICDVYDWDDDHVLKLFHNWFQREDIEHELKISRAVYSSGVKTPAVGEMILGQGRVGLLYQRVDGKSMFEILLSKPWRIFAYARLFAKLHFQMHATIFQSNDIPSQKGKLERRIKYIDSLPSQLKTSLLGTLTSLPEGNRGCHGDFHPGNVLVTDKGGLVIDWIDAARGNPLADVARTSILLQGMAENQVPSLLLKNFIWIFHTPYLRNYIRLHPFDTKEYR